MWSPTWRLFSDSSRQYQNYSRHGAEGSRSLEGWLGNNRPISNLSFLSNTLERIVASQIDEYLHDNGLYAKIQSAYGKYHSTETALIRVVNDIRRAVDDQCESILVLLDLSAAFDTIDHAILLERLRFRYGLSNLVLQWFTSYLVDRTKRIMFDKFSFQPRRLSCGVPQGSILGPVLFSLYISPLEDVITAHGLKAITYLQLLVQMLYH